MSIKEVINILLNEVECIKRGSTCNRDCLHCELVREDKELLEAYDIAISILRELSINGKVITYEV